MIAKDTEQSVINLITGLETKRRARVRDGITVSELQIGDWLFGVELLLGQLGRTDLLSLGIDRCADDTPAEPAGPMRGRS